MRLPSSLFAAALAFVAISSTAFAQYKMQTPADEAPGPWLFGTIGVGKGPDGKPLTTALKGLAIKLGKSGEAGIAYDLDLCRVAGAWTGGKFVTPMNLMSRGEYPTAMGEVMFTTEPVPGFIVEESGVGSQESDKPWKDPRPEPFGPLPMGQARFKGLYVNGDKRILKWEIAGTEVLEMPEFALWDGQGVLLKTLRIGPSEHVLKLPMLATRARGINRDTRGWTISEADTAGNKWRNQVLLMGQPEGTFLELSGGHLQLCVPAHKTAIRLKVLIEHQTGLERTGAHATRFDETVANLEALTKGSTPRWPDSIATTAADARTQSAIRDPQPSGARQTAEGSPQGEPGRANQSAIPYVVDTVKLPDPNPWSAPMFIGGFDFFPDGRAAVCTFHGDVFLVSGLEGDLKNVTWRRFASGLYHALGLEIVKGEIYVTCRDGLWRLKDLNNDGECDFYEPFNFDLKVTKSFHEFVFDLQTDKAGNFYFAKAGPVKNGGRGFDEIMSHHGTLLRVSPDGGKLDVVATGFRAPNGIGVGPHGELTSGENEGTWTPACKINWIKPGGFSGVVDLAHRSSVPANYDPPLCWLPKRIDNSGGSQVWVPDDERWGPWRGQMLHLSYGHAALYGVMREEVDGVMQGGVTRFPLKFESGIMRARFHPKDGQLWVGGLRGWQTDGIRNGCLQRVRYTGGPMQMPIELHAKKTGIELRFTSSIDTQSAADPENWNVEVWNYLWSSAYGSPEISTIVESEKPAEGGSGGVAEFSRSQMSKTQHDPLKVKSVTVGTDDRSVFLEIENMKPAMQMAIRYAIKSADGSDLEGEVVNTVHVLGE